LNRKIKLIWDFRGPEAAEIAKHHVVHLMEFALKESLDYKESDIEPISEMYCIAFITVNESDMKIYRDALRPHRGLVAK
jgi:hypothetical protein